MPRTYNAFQYDPDLIKRLAESHLTEAEIAKQVGCARSTVHRILRRIGANRARRFEVRRLQVVDRYRRMPGADPQALAMAFDVSVTTVRRWLRKAGVLRPYHRRDLTPHLGKRLAATEDF